jgi:hypothetical protein
MPLAARPFIRFVVGPLSEPAHRLSGLFRFPDELEHLPGYSPERREAIDAAYEWFNQHLVVPAFGAIKDSHQTVCWFRSDSGEILCEAWRLAIAIADLGICVRYVCTFHPGPIAYFDEHQIVARRPIPGRRRDCYWEKRLQRDIAPLSQSTN